MPTRTFTVAQLDELDVSPWSSTILANIEGYSGRWSTTRHLVFEHEGAFWMVDYDEPATEMQEGQDRWPNGDADDAEVPATEVIRVPTITDEWHPADKIPQVDYAAAWIIDGLAGSFHDMDDDEAPFGIYAQTDLIGRGALRVSPDTDPENWDAVDPLDRLGEHTDLPEGTAPEVPVVIVVAKRIR